MNYFECRICGKFKDDGNPYTHVCAMCVLSKLPLDVLQKRYKSVIMGNRKNNTGNFVK